MTRLLRTILAVTLLSVLAALHPACHSPREPKALAAAPESPEACRTRQDALTEFVQALPSRAVASPTKIEIPVSTLGAVPGAGALVEIGASELVLDGAPAAGADPATRMARFAEWVKELARSDSAPSSGARARSADGNAKRILYVAAAADLDVRTLRTYLSKVPDSVELRLLVRPDVPPGVTETDAREEARRVAERLLLERDPEKERALAAQGYAKFATCDAVASAVSSVAGLDREKRWPALQTALAEALPTCDCRNLDTASLRWILSADQRAGAGSLGWIPLSFIRDDRCDASMPKRSLKKLVAQMERFDQDFSGGWQKDALAFVPVLTSERLGVYFCDALPGETLEAKAHTRATLHLRVASRSNCDAWTFEPLAPGSPYGTLRRVAPKDPALAFHYRQAAEELRLMGPLDPATKSLPTDEREWACDENVKLTSIDGHSITTDKGRWFYGEEACKAAGPEVTEPPSSPGCFAEIAAGTWKRPDDPMTTPKKPPTKAK